jgi:hypothetical protein
MEKLLEQISRRRLRVKRKGGRNIGAFYSPEAARRIEELAALSHTQYNSEIVVALAEIGHRHLFGEPLEIAQEKTAREGGL